MPGGTFGYTRGGGGGAPTRERAYARLGRLGRLGNLVGYVLYEQTKRAQPESKFGFSDPPFRHDGRQVRFRILERDYRGEELDRFRLLREQTANLSTWQSRAS